VSAVDETVVLDGQLLRSLLTQCPLPAALHDTDLRYVVANEALARLDGHSVAEHLGRLPSEVLGAELGDRVETLLRRVRDGGESVIERDFRVPDPATGESATCFSVWSPAHDAAGRLLGVGALLIDDTHRRRSEEALRRTQLRATRLQEAMAGLAGAQTVDEVAQVVAEAGGAALGALRTSVGLVDGARLRFPRTAQPALAGSSTRLPLTGDQPGLSALAVRTGRPQYAADGKSLLEQLPYDSVREHLEGGTDERAWAALPLVTSGPALGVLRCAFADPRALDADERVFLEALAAQCALALERAVLYERERRAAVSLQRSLLPGRLPEVAGLELAYCYLPASSEAEVGGDWYDAFVLPDGRIAVVVGDVMGNGLTAAAGMGRMRAAVRALALTDPAPAAVLTGLDRLAASLESDEALVTLVYAVIDLATGAVLASDAGHLPVLLLRGDGTALLVDAGPSTTPIGVPETRVERRLALTPGSVVVAFTDGLVEHRGRPLTAGLDQLVEVAAQLAVDDLDALVAGLAKALLGDRDHLDDVTILAVRVAGALRSPTATLPDLVGDTG